MTAGQGGCSCGWWPGAPGMVPVAHCCVCHADMWAAGLADHARRMHPASGDVPATWPDGQPAVFDLDLEPEDFTL